MRLPRHTQPVSSDEDFTKPLGSSGGLRACEGAFSRAGRMVARLLFSVFFVHPQPRKKRAWGKTAPNLR